MAAPSRPASSSSSSSTRTVADQPQMSSSTMVHFTPPTTPATSMQLHLQQNKQRPAVPSFDISSAKIGTSNSTSTGSPASAPWRLRPTQPAFVPSSHLPLSPPASDPRAPAIAASPPVYKGRFASSNLTSPSGSRVVDDAPAQGGSPLKRENASFDLSDLSSALALDSGSPTFTETSGSPPALPAGWNRSLFAAAGDEKKDNFSSSSSTSPIKIGSGFFGPRMSTPTSYHSPTADSPSKTHAQARASESSSSSPTKLGSRLQRGPPSSSILFELEELKSSSSSFPSKSGNASSFLSVSASSFAPSLRPADTDQEEETTALTSLSLISKLDLDSDASFSHREEQQQKKSAFKQEELNFANAISKQETRYIFVSGLPTGKDAEGGCDLTEVTEAFKKYLPLRGIYARDLYTHGTVILSTYDVRDASRALGLLNAEGHYEPAWSYRRLSASFITRELLIQFANGAFGKRILSPGEGKLVVKSVKTLDPAAVENYIRGFGDVKIFSPLPSDNEGTNVFKVEFYDDQKACGAFEEVKLADIAGLSIEWENEELLDQHLVPNFADSPPAYRSSPGQHQHPLSSGYFTSSFSPAPFAPLNGIIDSSSSLEKGAPKYIPPRLRSQHSFSDTFARPSTQEDKYISSGESTPFGSPTKGASSFSPLPVKPFPDGFSPATSTNSSPTRPLNARRAFGLENDAPAFPASGSYVPNDPPRRGGAEAWGLIRDDPIPDNNLIRLDLISRGIEKRTSCIIRNLPNKMTQLELMEILDEVVPRQYDFLYLRFDFQSGSNCGFGFVNFLTPDALVKFWSAKLGTLWDAQNSRKLVMGGFANIQGKKALMERFRNSSVMDQAEEYRPKIFFSSGPSTGLPEPFPPSNNAQRKAKSAYSTGLFGLYGNKPKGGFKSVRME